MRDHMMHYGSFARTALLAAALCSGLGAQAPCSIETVRGVWVETTGVGTAMVAAPGSPQPVPAPVTALGMYSIDEQGQLTGWFNIILAGNYSDATIAGRVAVNSNCTGTIRFTVTPLGAPGPLPGEGAFRILVLDNGNEIRAMSVTDFPMKYTGVETHRRIVRDSQAAPRCTAETVRGTYGGVAEGIVLMTVPGQTQPLPAPYSGIGALAIDGEGGVTGGSTASIAGEKMESELADASLQVFPDCTGHLSYRLRPKRSAGGAAGRPREGRNPGQRRRDPGVGNPTPRGDRDAAPAVRVETHLEGAGASGLVGKVGLRPSTRSATPGSGRWRWRSARAKSPRRPRRLPQPGNAFPGP